MEGDCVRTFDLNKRLLLIQSLKVGNWKKWPLFVWEEKPRDAVYSSKLR